MSASIKWKEEKKGNENRKKSKWIKERNGKLILEVYF